MALHRYNVALFVALAVSVTMPPSHAADNSNSLEAVNAQLRLKNFSRAAELLKPLAEGNNAAAEVLLANLYRQGLGVNADIAQAQHWLTRAAEQGNAQAMYELASMLANAEAPDHALIEQWLQHSAKAGFALAAQALHDNVMPQQFQPAALSDAAARRSAYWLAASHDDVAQLSAFKDASLLKAADEFGRTALLYAAGHGAMHAVNWLLQAGADINQADSFGITPLMLAAGAGQATIVTQLLTAGARADMQDRSGNNALMYAIGKQHPDCVNALLTSSDIKQRNVQSWSALEWAIQSGDSALIARLRGMGLESSRKRLATNNMPAIPLQHASSSDLYSNWPDVLIASTRSGTQLFDAVLQANGNALRTNETTSLLLAVQADNAALIDRLLTRGAAVTADTDESPLGWAIRHGKANVVQKLLATGIKPDTHGKKEALPLLAAAHLPGPVALDIMDALLKAGANPDVRDQLGRSALIISAQAQQPALVERLLHSGADSGLQDNSGHTALMYAALNANEPIAAMLAAEKTAIDKRDNEGNTALLLAISAGNANVVATLVAAGASTQANKAGVTVLMLAAARAQDGIVKKLLNTGTKVDAQDRHGDTALIYAARQGNLAAVRALLSAGANAQLRNNDRASAADVAERLAFKDVAAALTQHG